MLNKQKELEKEQQLITDEVKEWWHELDYKKTDVQEREKRWKLSKISLGKSGMMTGDS